MRFLRVLLLFWIALSTLVYADIEYNTINEDGSFRFRHANDDIGTYYHSASGTPDNIVEGRYGSRNPATGRVEETVYTAGPRGFRVNGPKIHRKMDLAQYPVLPRGSPDDPLADPYDDPSYSFSYRASDHSRSETNDATGRVRGLYSFIDDVGERHSVRYAAGAGTGYEVINSVPDNPANVGYANPLYKAHPATRGKMSVQRGPLGSYKLIAAGPDHRRAESRGSDGYVRGTYSFLDDKGVQRTVEYIAGAGIGYRVLQNSVGAGTHINPTVANFRLADRDFRLANDFGRGAGASSGSSGGGTGGGSSNGEYLRTDEGGAGGGSDQGGSSVSQDENSIFSGSSGSRDQMGSREISFGGGGGGGSGGGGTGDGSSGGGRGDGGGGSGGGTGDGSSGGGRGNGGSGSGRGDGSSGTGRGNGGSGGGRGDGGGGGGGGRGNGGSGSGRGDGSSGGGRGDGGGGGGGGRGNGGSGGGRGDGSSGGGRGDGSSGTVSGRNGMRMRPGSGVIRGQSGGSSRGNDYAGGDGSKRVTTSSKLGGGESGGSGTPGYLYDPPSGSADNYNLNDDDVVGSLPPLVTTNHRILEINRQRDWVQRHRDSTVIKNVGKWYVELPPGQSVRAHVQNIDLVPLGGRILSPSEALRQDEIADLAASREH